LEAYFWGTFGVYNNLFSAVDAANSTGLLQGTGTTITADYNILWRWGTAYSGLSAGAHDLALDPLLLDPFNGVYKLQAASPCIDAGDNNAPGRPGNDFQGWLRPYDGDGNGSDVVDMGAYEFRYVNAPPIFTSVPALDAAVGVVYSYSIIADDTNLPDGDALEVTADIKPDWLMLMDHGDGTATLSGIPASGDLGDHTVTLRVTDLDGAYDTQLFTITVTEGTSIYFPLLMH
jgi:hypothetical protein